MIDFLEWLNEANSSVVIDDRELRQAFKVAAEKIIDSMHERKYQASRLNPQQFIQIIQKELAGYPLLPNLVRALQSKNVRYIFDQQSKLRDWLYKQSNRTSDLLTISRQIYTYIDTFDQDHHVDESQVWHMVEQAIVGTQQEMAKLKAMIEQAISRIANWGNPPVIISPSVASSQYGGYEIAPTSSASVSLNVGSYPPQFSIFQDENRFEIDDVLEGGEPDFFETPQVQSDYFNLINELRKPGSTSRGRNLILYTARPVADRQQFISQKTLPVNVFLSNDYSDVEGISRDFGKRDIWKVRIDSRYLTQTLDGKVKHYQITVPNAPVMSLELITPAE